MFTPIAAVLDAVSILLFAALGLQTHAAGFEVRGVLGVAWPFLLAAATAWLVTRAWRHPRRVWPAGVVLWLITATGGLALRGLSGGGLAPAFQLVTLGFLALTLLGHRLILTAVFRVIRVRTGRTRRGEMN